MRARFIATALAAVGLGLGAAGPASAEIGYEFMAGEQKFELQGADSYKGGGHPDVHLRFSLKPDPSLGGVPGRPAAGTKDTDTFLPAGLVGAPKTLTTCPMTDVLANEQAATTGRCPRTSAAGFAIIDAAYPGTGANVGVQKRRLWSVEPQKGEAAAFAGSILGVPFRLVAYARPSNGYRISIEGRNITHAAFVRTFEATIWGVPADHQGTGTQCDGLITPTGFVFCTAAANPDNKWDGPLGGDRVPFVTAPSSCDGQPLSLVHRMTPWGDSFPAFEETFTTPQALTGCDQQPFEPSASVAVANAAADAPTGMNVSVDNPQHLGNPDGVAAAHIRDVSVDLPEGLTINPGSANGLEACTDAQVGLGEDHQPSCPEASKVATATATTPLLEEQLSGSVYVRTQNSADPESGELFRIALVLENADRGVLVKLAGSLKVDSQTGRIAATFANNPQLPVESIQVSFKDGPRAPLATPASCGTHSIATTFASWAGHNVPSTSGFDVACGPNVGAFAPSLAAGARAPVAGGFSPFAVNVSKPDGNSAVTGVEMRLPTGLLAQLRGNLGTQVGSVKAFAGPGSNPYVLPGQVYLEGRYGDAPYSLRAVVPAKAGPFDLGEVVVRQKLYVDPDDAHVTVVSDPLPTIVGGVPARLQRLEVSIDKPGFTLNPTSCAVKEIASKLGSPTGQTADSTSRFKVDGCGSLGFTPKVAMGLTGAKQVRTGGHPGLTATYTQPGGQANTAKAKVTLPKSVVLDPKNSVDPALLCGYDDGQRASCPASSVIGKATVQTPLLERPLTGNVHLVQGIRFGPDGNRIRTTPGLLVKLTGEVDVNLRATTTAVRGRLVTTFDNTPDAPVTRLDLDVNGGRKGILVVTRTRKAKINICNSKQIATVETAGHNGKTSDYKTTVATPCRRAKKAKRAAAKRKAAAAKKAAARKAAAKK